VAGVELEVSVRHLAAGRLPFHRQEEVAAVPEHPPELRDRGRCLGPRHVVKRPRAPDAVERRWSEREAAHVPADERGVD